MKKSSETQITVRNYLLGDLTDEVEIRRLEEKIMLDDNFNEEFSIAEDDLIDDYLNGRLSNAEVEKFDSFFRRSPQRKEKLWLIVNLRKYAARNLIEPDAKKPVSFDWRSLFSSPIFSFALILLMLGGIGFAVWRVGFYESATDKGLAQLRAAYKGKRPIESRTTAKLDYAPVSETRGETNASAADEKTRNRAELLLLDANENKSDAKAHHALGLFYLNDKKFDAALKEFDLALKLAPENAELHNDNAAARLEKAKKAGTENKPDESLENLALALKSVNRALELNAALPEGLFNKALILEEMRLDNQAQTAWENYLKSDSTSEWANEARRNLEKLQKQNGAAKDKSQVLKDFLESFKNKDDPRAWQIAAQTKELITGVMIQTQLAQNYLNADNESRKDDAAEILSAFLYLGKLEKENSGDVFFERLANYYANANAGQKQRLMQAHAAMQSGYASLLKADWKTALETFQQAITAFSEAGDDWEAGIAEYQIGYTLCQLKQIKESTAHLQKLADLAEKENYKWLQSLADGWTGNNYSITGEHSRAISFAGKSLKTSEAIADTYNIQKVSNHLTHEYLLIGNSSEVLMNIRRSFDFSNAYFSSSRQQSRNLLIATRGLYSFKFYDAAAAFSDEQIRVAESQSKDAWLTHSAHVQLALIYAKAGKFADAYREIETGFRLAESFPNETMRQTQTTETRLTLAEIQREAGDCPAAIGNFSRTIEDYGETDFSIYKYAARKGRLDCYVELKDDAAVKNEMPAMLKLFDENRSKIAEESNRNIFFDGEQTVYDIAADYAYTRLRDGEQAFDYAENSRARSLLDLVKSDQTPLTLAEIRRQMPADLQIIYYAVLEDKLLIWHVTNSRFTTAEKSINADDLNDLVEWHAQLLYAKSDTRQTAKELYEILIAPVESTLEPDKPLCIIADKTLFRVPFAALISPRTDKYLIEKHALLYAPSATIFINETAIAATKSAERNETILSVGNPTFSRKNYPELADLPDAKREAVEISTLYASPKLFVGDAAEKNRIIENTGESDVLHFASHYVPNALSPSLSKFPLASGDDLTVEEIMRVKLPRTRLIILSACETGIEKYYKGEGMIGAARAFLASDVPLVVASQWSVESNATAELMINFHRSRKQKRLATINALRHAQVEMLNGGAPFSQPYYWAGFLPIGGYAAY